MRWLWPCQDLKNEARCLSPEQPHFLRSVGKLDWSAEPLILSAQSRRSKTWGSLAPPGDGLLRCLPVRRQEELSSSPLPSRFVFCDPTSPLHGRKVLTWVQITTSGLTSSIMVSPSRTSLQPGFLSPNGLFESIKPGKHNMGPL